MFTKKDFAVLATALLVVGTIIYFFGGRNFSSMTVTVKAQAVTPLLYTTLDDAASVVNPVNGTGAGALVTTSPANDFVPGHTGNGLRVNATGEYAQFQETDGVTQNVELDKGTIDFWYQPNYANTDGLSHRVFNIGTTNQAGSITMYKRVTTYGNDLYFQIKDSAGTNWVTTVPSTSYGWTAGQWVNIRFTWDSTVPAGVQNEHVYINGTEVSVYKVISTGPFTMPAESSALPIYIGAISPTDTSTALGVIDEFKIYPGALIPQDTVPPTVPTGVVATAVSSSQVNLSWTASTDNAGVAGYIIVRNGIQIGMSTTTSYQDINLSPATTYSYFVFAFDTAGNVSAQSAVSTVTTPGTSPTPDTTVPTAPTGLSANPVSTTQVDLVWTASTDNVGVTGYAVFRNGVQIATASGTSYSDTNLSPNTTYAYYIVAFDAAGNNSAQSAPSSAQTLSDTVAPTVSVSAPISGATLTGIVTLSATAADNVAVAGVQFQLDGASVGAEKTTTPYSVTLNTTALLNGPHTITAVARDTSNNTTTSVPIAVTVNNVVVGGQKKNIVVVMTDDQRYDFMQYMPITSSYLSSEAVQFDNTFATTPECCPSRSTFLTGLYSHNHGVLTSGGNLGGAKKFNPSTTTAVMLKNAGYNTALFGKYLNGFKAQNVGPKVPPGWSKFLALYGKSDDDFYYGFTVDDNGTVKTPPSTTYSTDYLATAAKNYILSTPTSTPLFLVWTPFGPHSALGTTTSGTMGIASPKPAAQDLGTFSNLPPIRTPAFNEADVSDKPLWLQALPSLTPLQITAVDTFNQRAVEALQSVDRGAGQIFSALQQTGRWNNTLVIFVGDNGIANGEHRVDNTKFCPYEECMRVPLWIRVPGATARHDSNLIGNIDFAPTILDWAGVPSTASKMNGVSLMPLITNPGSPWRSNILFELIGTGTTTHNFQGVRTSQYLYNEYQDGEKELYDLQVDPYELTNVVNDPSYAGVIPGLQTMLANLKSQ